MPGNKPVKKGMNQTEKRAKGLLANVGDYKGKTLNLTKKQLGASGMKAFSARKIAISQTRYDKASKKVLGPMGKPITGRVDLGGGNIAVYKNGVRVRAGSSATSPKASGGGDGRDGGGGGGGGGPKTSSMSNIEKLRNARNQERVNERPSRPSKLGTFPRTQGQAPYGAAPVVMPGSSRGGAGGASGGRASGTGPTGTPTQQRIRVIKNKIADARARARASAAQANKNAAAAAQAKRDAQTLKDLEAQLRALQ